MNRLVTTNLLGVSPDTLPPKVRTGPARVLFLSTQMLGLKVFTNELENRTQQREDIDAVHIRLVPSLQMKILGKQIRRLKGYDFQSYRYLYMWGSRISRWLRGPLSHLHFDVIHITTQNNALGILSLPKDAKCKIVIDIDSTALQEAHEFQYGMFDRWPIVRAERKMFARADLIACWSEWAKRSVIDDYGVSDDRTMVSRVGVSIPQPSRLAIEDKERTDRFLRIVFVGNDWQRKGGPRLLKWHQDRWKDSVELHVFGAGASRNQSSKNVVWHGPTPRNELLSELLLRMDIFVLPTLEDTLVLAAVEAQGVGVPVVISNLAGIATDAVRDNETGILCDARDDTAFIAAIEKLLYDSSLRKQMSASARSFALQEWSADIWYNRHLNRIVELARS